MLGISGRGVASLTRQVKFHLVGTVVACRRQPEKEYALGVGRVLSTPYREGPD